MKEHNRLLTILTWFCYWLILIFFYHRPNHFEFTLVKATFIGLNHFAIFYICTKYLLPKLYDSKRWFLLIGSGVLLTLLFLYFNFQFSLGFDPIFSDHFVERLFDRAARGKKRFHPSHILFMREISLNIIVLFASTIYHLNTKLRLKQQREIELENENLDAEMNFLKSQINPHFLFNAMNNVYSLAIRESKEVPDKILKLSEMLRYVLYHTDNKHVQIRQEIGYIKNFIDFQLLKDDRYAHAISLELNVQNDKVSIAPMILIPFIENAFKHGQIDEQNPLTIQLEANEETLNFSVHNALNKGNYIKDKTGGIGILNVKRRLDLLYREKQSLQIEQSDTSYSVQLTIQLES